MADTRLVGGILKPGVLGIEQSTTELSSLQTLGVFAVPEGPYTKTFGGFLKPGVPNAPLRLTTELSSLQALNLFTISIGPYTRTFDGFLYTGVPNAPLRLSTFMLTGSDPVTGGTGGSGSAVATNIQNWTMG